MQTFPDVSSDVASVACRSIRSTVAGLTTYLNLLDSRALVMMLAAPSAGHGCQESVMKMCLDHCCSSGYTFQSEVRCVGHIAPAPPIFGDLGSGVFWLLIYVQ